MSLFRAPFSGHGQWTPAASQPSQLPPPLRLLCLRLRGPTQRVLQRRSSAGSPKPPRLTWPKQCKQESKKRTQSGLSSHSASARFVWIKGAGLSQERCFWRSLPAAGSTLLQPPESPDLSGDVAASKVAYGLKRSEGFGSFDSEGMLRRIASSAGRIFVALALPRSRLRWG